jgi:hypothetical protein
MRQSRLALLGLPDRLNKKTCVFRVAGFITWTQSPILATPFLQQIGSEIQFVQRALDGLYLQLAHMGIDHGRRKTAVSQKRLYIPNIGLSLYEVGGIAVPEHVDTALFRNTGLLLGFSQDQLGCNINNPKCEVGSKSPACPTGSVSTQF